MSPKPIPLAGPPSQLLPERPPALDARRARGLVRRAKATVRLARRLRRLLESLG